MKKYLSSIIIFAITAAAQTTAHATDLMEVFAQALTSDPTYQQAVAQRMADQENVPVNFSGFLPNAVINGTPGVWSRMLHGGATIPGSNTQRGYDINLTVTQTIFDFGLVARLRGAYATANQADAAFTAALQDLIIRIATNYFNILKDEDNLNYINATKTAYAKQLDQVSQQYRVGLKTLTDVYTAQASYDSAAANYIAAQTQLANDKENLRVNTGIYYENLAKLSEQFPLITPQPNNIDSWVDTAKKQNWSVKAAEFALTNARENVKQQYAGHLPTLNAQGVYDINYNRFTGSALDPGFFTNGSAKITTKSLTLNLVVPVFQGGYVSAKTRQAKDNYQVAAQKLEYQLRSTINSTHQSFLGVISGIKQIQADRQTIKSTQSSLEGLDAGYRVGTQTLVDVLNQQQKVFQAQQQYANDRYAYVINLLSLKRAAGTLSPQDLQAVNSWLRSTTDHAPFKGEIISKQNVAVKKVAAKKLA